MEYIAEVYDGLNEFSAAREALSVSRGSISIIGENILEYGAEEALGVSLLHKHFDLLPSERLVKTITIDGAITTPVVQYVDSTLVPYLWKLDVDKGRGSLRPLEFLPRCSCPDYVRSLSEAVSRSRDLATALAHTIKQQSMENVFGIQLLHMPDIKEDEVWLEETDSSNRVLSLTVSPEDHGIADATETLWVFERISDGDTVCDECRAASASTIVSRKKFRAETEEFRFIGNVSPEEVEPAPRGVCPPISCSICRVHCANHCSSHCHQHCHTHCRSHCKTHK